MPVKKTKSEYRRIGEVAKRLFSKSWVTRYGGGDEAEAAKRLAKKYGFSGMEPYMHTLCKLFVDCPERAHFESAVASLVEGTARQIISSLKDCEVDVDPVLRKGTKPEKFFVGDCFHRAMDYAGDHMSEKAVIVHGQIADGLRTVIVDHAWVELPGGIVFDGVTQRFYDLNAYYARRSAVKKKAYGFIEALRLNCEHGDYGPWWD